MLVAVTSAAFCMALILAACGPIDIYNPPTANSSLLTQTANLSPTQPPPETPTPLPSPTDTPTPLLYISPAVPPALRQAALASGLSLTDSPEVATDRLDLFVNLSSAISNLQSTIWIYALVAPFPTVTDGITADELRRAWAGESAGPFAGAPLLMSESTLAAFTAGWGAPGSSSVRSVPDDQLLDVAWAERPSWAIIPFESLDLRWKVLTIDGQSPIHKDFYTASYPLKATFAFQSSNLQPVTFNLQPSNRDPSKMTTLVMTGVTALVRATAWKMEQNGLFYPGQDIRDGFLDADIVHISNEIPFAPGCPYPNPNPVSLIFCSDPRYIVLLDYIGADVIELTGNHFQDWGSEATLYTLDLYDQRGWPTFGGGADLADSRQPAFIEHNGNQLAFIGCNPAGPVKAWATESQPGAAPCDDYQWMADEITRLAAAGYIPVATFQYWEQYYPRPLAEQEDAFRMMADAGAVIVSGSQSHAPMAMEFFRGAFIHYGLGNLFFDQMDYTLPNGQVTTATRNEFLDRYIIYEGKVISVELLTARLEDYSRPRPMTPEERADLLEFIFHESGW